MSSIYEAVKATRRLTKNGLSPGEVEAIVRESYGFTGKQVAPLLVDARGLSPQDFQQAKRDLIRTTELHRRNTATPFQPKQGGNTQ